MVNPRTFIDVQVDGKPLGRIVFELFQDVTPKTAENFRCLCTGEKGISSTSGKPLHYKGAPIHRIIDQFMIQGGDFTRGDGKGGESIYGGPFEDENFEKPVDAAGLLVMANRGPNTNSSQFFITLAPADHLTGKHVVFGRVVSGIQHVEALGKLPVDPKDRPLDVVVISHCGELERRVKPAAQVTRQRSRSVSASSGSGSDSDASASSSSQERRKRRRKEEKRSKKEKKHKHKKSRHREASRDKEPTAEERAEAEAQQARAAALEKEMERERAVEQERRRRELERMREKLAREASKDGIVYKGRGQMRYRDHESRGGMRGWD